MAFNYRLSLLAPFLLLINTAPAATLNLKFDPEVGLTPDTIYPETSTVSVGSTNSDGIVATLAGRGYGVEQTGSARWGIAAGALEWDDTVTGWTVRNGFAPNAMGSTVSTTGLVQLDASFICIELSGMTEGTRFRNMELTFSDVTFLRPANTWAGTSADAFATATPVAFSAFRGVQKLSVTLPDFTWIGGDPLEIRVYGVIGSDEGAFNFLSLAGETLSPVTVPEPSGTLLVSAAGLGALISYRPRRRTEARSFRKAPVLGN